jgi:hypothetical protein
MNFVKTAQEKDLPEQFFLQIYRNVEFYSIDSSA